MPRRFGPVQAAGTAVIELDGDRLIQPAALGVVALFGKTRKGPTDELIHCPSRSDFIKKCGDFVDDSELPDAAFDFWNLGNGRGEMFVVRITDGTEVEATETFFSRRDGHGYRYGTRADAGWQEGKQPMVSVTAKNGGRWGGRKAVLTGSVATVATDITATTVTTGITMPVNKWKGATLRLLGVTSRTYEVVSNSSAGVVTVKSDQTMAADLAAGGDPTNAKWELVLDTEVQEFPTRLAGTRRALSIVWKDGQEDESAYFGMEVYEDQVKVLDYPNLSMDPANKWFLESVVNEDTSNFWVEVSSLFTGTYTADTRPVNWKARAQEWASDTVTIPIAFVRSVTSVNDDVGWVGNFTVHGTPRTKKARITLTFTNSTTYTVATDEADGAEQNTLPNGTVGTAYAAYNRHMIGWKVVAGQEAWSTGDVIVIDVLPLPVDEDGNGLLKGGYVYPDYGADTRTKVQIKSNTVNTITLVSAPSPTPDEALAATTAINTGTLVFPLTLVDTSLTLIHSTFGVVVLTIAAGPHATNTALAAAINTAWQSATSSAGDIAAPSSSPANSVDLTLDDSGVDTEKGYESFLIVGSNASTDLSLTAGEDTIGTLGDEIRIEAPTELRNGYDGQNPADSDFLAAAQPANESLISRIMGQNKGLVKLATPGVTSTTVQQAYLELASQYSYCYAVEIPSNVTDDSAAVAYINDTIGRSDFGFTHFPSYAYVPNPRGRGSVLRTLTGAILGREALEAANYDGYHKVAAGIGVTLPNVVRLPTGDRILNEEILNPKGVNVIKKSHGSFVIWGARTIALDPNWQFKQHRFLMSHYERVLLENFDFIIFAINDAVTQGVVKTSLTAYFLQEWQKRALRGAKPTEAYEIKVDGENNTNLSMAQGLLRASVKLRLADTTELFEISVSKAGVFETLGS